MKLPASAVAAARRHIGDRELGPYTWYIPAGGELTIGYLVIDPTQPHAADTAQIEVIHLSQRTTPVEVRTTVRRAPDAGLYWLTIQQGAGAVLYKWKDPAGSTQHILVYATNRADLEVSRRQSKAQERRLMQKWRMMHVEHQPEEVVQRLLDAVKDGRIGWAVFRLISHLRKGLDETDHNNPDALRAALAKLSNADIQSLLGTFRGLTYNDAICKKVRRGIALVIGRR